jgi:hypothetical protein
MEFSLAVWVLGFGVWDLGFGVWGLGFGVWGLGFGDWGLGFKGQESQLRVWSSPRWRSTYSRSSAALRKEA